MLAAGVAALSALVPGAGTEACAAAIVSLLRRYTTGLSLAVAADELERGPPAAAPAVYRGRVTQVSVAPLLTWHVAGVPGAVLYAHSRLAGVEALGFGVRLRAQEAGSLADSPASVVAAARRTLGDTKVVLHLPTRELVLEPPDLPAGLALKEVWARKELSPAAVRAVVAEVDPAGEWVRLVDQAPPETPKVQEEAQAQPSVIWRLQDCQGIADLLSAGEDVVVTLPTVQPTGPSFEILHGPMSVVYAAPKAESSTRPTKRARKSRREGGRTFFGFEAETGIMDVGIEKGAMGRGIMTINSVSEDFRDGVVAVCKHGYRLAFAAGENEARVLLPGTAVWLDEVAWDAGRNAWIVHNFLNLSEMRALLHSPFCREAVSVASLPSIEKRRGYCTVQASVRVLAVTGIDDLHAFLKVEDVPMPGKKMPPASNGESTAVTLLAPESVVRSVFDLSIRSLNELANHEDEGRTLLPETLLTSIVITKDRLDGFRFIIAAAAPAPVDW